MGLSNPVSQVDTITGKKRISCQQCGKWFINQLVVFCSDKISVFLQVFYLPHKVRVLRLLSNSSEECY